jgi:PAS domain S-box-containing protein
MSVDTSASTILDAVGTALIGTDLEGTVTIWNLAAETLYGWTAAEALGRNVMDLTATPQTMAESSALLAQVVRDGSWTGDHPVRRRDGSTFLAHVRVRPLLGGDGSVIGLLATSGDLSELRVAQAQREEGDDRLRLALEAGEFGTWDWDQATGVVHWDRRLEEIFGFDPETFPMTFEAYSVALHPDDRAQVLAAVERAMETRSRYAIEHRIVRPDGTVRWIEGRGQVLVRPDGEVRGTTGCVRDVTDLKAAETERETLRASERLLAEAGEQLSQSLDVEQVLATTADLVVPDLADLLTVRLLDPDTGALEPAIVRHALPDGELVLRRLTERFALDAQADLGPAYVVRTGEAQVSSRVSDDHLRTLALNGEHLAHLRDLRIATVAIVPLTARGRTIGAATLARSTHRPYTATELGTVGELTRRAAMALDNALSYARERSAALTLQRSLMPHVVPVPGVELHASYLPGAEGTEVGGDWYDVIARPDGSTVIGIGDVMGRGITAAALMGQVSTAARAYALAGFGPAELLDRLHGIVADRGEGQIVTCCYAVLSPGAHELVVASAGHLPPLTARATGETAYIDVPVDVPLGARLVRTGPPAEATVTLAKDTVVAMFTDGLIEDPSQALDVGMERARAAIGSSVRPLSQVSADLLELREPTSADDVAILLLRV